MLDTKLLTKRFMGFYPYLSHGLKLTHIFQVIASSNMADEVVQPTENIPDTSFFLTPKPYGSPMETALGVAYIILVIMGIPSNIVSVIHFSTQTARARSTREYFKWIYTNIALVDLAITVFCFPVIAVFLDDKRNSVFFHDDMFCKFWGFLWEVLPYYSVFLVLVMSISRMLILVKPMMVLSKRLLFFTLAIYNILLITAKVTFYMAEITKIDFTKRDTLCILTYVEANQSIYPVYTFFNIILLAVPIIPICISCFLSISRMYKTDQAVRGKSTRKSTGSMRKASIKKSQMRHRRATVTVILMTVTYIVCNIPVFLNYVLYGVWSAFSWSKNPKNYEEFYGTTFMFYYSWNSCLVLFVLINAAVNPIIYLTRMKEFRQFVIGKFHILFTDNLRDLTQYDQTESLS